MAEFFGVLTNERTRTYYAAQYEVLQAEREFTEAYNAFRDSGARAGSPEDYAMWHAAGYADAAQRAIRNMPVWES